MFFPTPFSSPSSPAPSRPTARATVGGWRGASRLFPVRLFRVCPRGAVRRLRVSDPSRGGRWSGRARPLPAPTPDACWGCGCRIAGVRPSRCPAFWPRVSAPLLSGYLAVAFRRGGLKTPGGVALPPPGSGGGRARRVSRSVCRLALPQTPRPPPLPPPPPLPRRCGRGVGGVCPEPPLGARGGSLRAPGLPVFRGPALSAVCACSRVDSRLFFRSPTLFFFHTCLVSFLAGRPEASPRSARLPPLSTERGWRACPGGLVCRRQQTP